ncbi:MAG: relaxase/mobilization nuclease domain-containing protein [Mobilitalea sp.]
MVGNFRKTGRKPKGDIITYQIHQSFNQGEITPKEANEIGYETAMRYTKGNHVFIVATYTDRAHIHNHIIFNSTNLDFDRKFRDSWFIVIALERVSNLVCLEHGMSGISPLKDGQFVNVRIIRKGKPSEMQFVKRLIRQTCRNRMILKSYYSSWLRKATKSNEERK